MMFRLLLIALFLGLACASLSQANGQKQSLSSSQQGVAHSNSHRSHHHHHRRHHRKAAGQILALDQLIKRKHAAHFLGRGFVAKALMSQQGDDKYLRLTGKENRDINGTISIHKKNVFVDLTENKDGHFLVKNKKQRIVGRVDMYSGNRKHLTVHHMKNGVQLINGYNSGSASLSLEKDVHSYRFRGLNAGKMQAPKKHMKMRVNQNHFTHGNVEISDIKAKNENDEETQQLRYRRQAEVPVETPCRELNCLNAVQI